MRVRTLQKSCRIAVVLATAAALLATLTTAGHRLEGLLPGWTSRFVPETDATRKVTVVAIDPVTLDNYGPWPWPRDRLIQVLERLQRFKPAALGVMLPLTDTETPPGLPDLSGQLDTLDKPLRARAAKWLRQLDTDAQLAQALGVSGKTVLAAQYTTADKTGAPSGQSEKWSIGTGGSTLSRSEDVWRLFASGRTFDHVHVIFPAQVFSDTAAGIGLVPAFREGQRVGETRLAIETGPQFLPSFELALLAAGSKRAGKGFTVDPGTGALHGGNAVLAGAGFLYFPRPASMPPVVSLKSVMADDSAAKRLRGKTVLLGLSTPGLAPRLRGPAHVSYTPLTWSAHLLDSMLANNAFNVPDWFFAGQRGLIVLLGLCLALLPPAWRGTRGTVACAVLAALLLNTGVLLLIIRNLWLPVVLPALFLMTTQLLLSFAHRRHRVLDTALREAVEARIALGCNLQSQGQLDGAREQLARCLPDTRAFEPLYELALEYERRRQVNRARGVYEQLEHFNRNYRDCAGRRARLDALSERFPTASPAGTGATLVLDTPMMELPVLGRYRLERELGRGAMGTVYLATDPTIGRQLAVKTLPVTESCESGEQGEIAARFFKEAEAVGRLDHPHIVAVHDAGREHDLAYIAMDYVPGESLDAWTAATGLLPVWEVLEIAAQVADALAYAHSRNVVHRDIKPANIIYDRDSGIAKITDFGVARLVDASRTRSGTVLGTPSYMSPEQVAGKKTDGRSDLFSLGTTLYQLLTGSLPFEGDSVATLMYQIANQKTPPLRKVRRGLPACVARLVGRALQKEPARRFSDGEAMAAALLNCRAQFKGGRRKTA